MLGIRVLLAPYEIGAYNRHAGYAAERYGFILGDRHIVGFGPDVKLVLPDPDRFVNRFADFIVHELTHYQQRVLIQRGGIVQNRGAHSDVGWFRAIAEAAPRYLGVRFPESAWPKQKPQPGRLTEVEVTHWPGSFRDLVAVDDPRLQIIRS